MEKRSEDINERRYNKMNKTNKNTCNLKKMRGTLKQLLNAK